MKLVTFLGPTGLRAGVLDAAGSSVIDIAAAVPGLPSDMQQLIEIGLPGLSRLRQIAQMQDHAIPLAEAALQAPLPRPRKNILCVGKNYHEHAAEFHNSGFDASAGKDATPEVPIIFTKWPNSVIGPGVPIPSENDETGSTDYEGELTVVIGRAGRGIAHERAFGHVFGYTIINDVTARTLQNRHRQWFLGKSLDGFCPMGPCIVTADEIPDVRSLRLETRVNGELRQSASVSELIFDIPTLIATLSRGMTLEPGDLIATGTCAGVGIGFKPPRFLSRGDIVRVTIEPIGSLENPVS